MAKNQKPPKSISEQIYELFLDSINEDELFDDQMVKKLEELINRNGLDNRSSVENIIKTKESNK